MFKRILPKSICFFNFFDDHIEHTILACECMQELTRADADRKEVVRRIKELEHKLAVADKEIDRLSAKGRELEAMSQRNMTSQQAISMNAKEMQLASQACFAVASALQSIKGISVGVTNCDLPPPPAVIVAFGTSAR